jgi:hypothetical protein
MIVSVLLMITTAGMVSVTVKSLRQSTDGAQSTKAYYAAEGGLEEALLKVRNGETVDNCDGATSGASAQDGVVTCAKVTQKTNEITGELGKNESAQVDLSSVSGLFAVRVEWGLDNYDPAQIPNYGANGFPEPNKPSGVQWGANAPGVIELGVIEYPRGRDFAIDQVGFYQGITAPKSARSGDPTSNLQANSLYNYKNLPNPTAINQTRAYVANCAGAAPYQCATAPVNFVGTSSYVLRIKSLYSGMRYRITAYNVSNAVLDIPGSMYTIDVTARAGDVFRRAQTSFSTVPESINGLDYVLYSDTNICKSFEIKGGIAQDLACSTP